MSNLNDKNQTNNNTQGTNNSKKPLPSGTITTTRSSIFELGSKNETKKD